MKKFNGHEAHIINEGLKLYLKALKDEIQMVEDKGKNHIMTQGYAELMVKEVTDKLWSMTKKVKKKI